MNGHDEPWLQTDRRVPYLLGQGLLPEGIRGEEAIARLENAYRRVNNVYNCATFALDDASTIVFSVKPCRKFALILLSSQAMETATGDDVFDRLRSAVDLHIERVANVLGCTDTDNAIRLRTWRFEVSRIRG